MDAFGQSINVDEAVTRARTEHAHPEQQGWSATANYTYMKSEQKSGPNVGNTLMDTPEHALNARLNWEPSRQWNVWLRAEYRSERFRDPGTTADTRAAKAALGDFRAYTQFHVGGSYKVTPQFTVNAAVYNLFNKDFVDYTAYTVPGAPAVTNYRNLYTNSQDGRRLWLSANYEF
ncbi:TonB-dependent receptor [Acidovorax sp. LjRoot118]|uniref:TonB-dependent receptor domain-containing protein n=1 Tax=Acidovorax sp. LjRoot118 TaxID=3342256 RepID=UPI003ECE3537